MTGKNVLVAFSYDTEQPVPATLPTEVISEEDFQRLNKDEKKNIWADFLGDAKWWTDPAVLWMSTKELETLSELSILFKSFDGEFTSFVLGKWLDYMVEAFGQEKVRGFFKFVSDIQSHSYEHKTFLSTGDATRDRLSAPLLPEEINLQLKQSKTSIFKHLGVMPIGLRTPMGNITPLEDRKVLSLFHENGFQFISSWLKKAQREPNSPLNIQPFFYSDMGFPDVLEIPGVGYYDAHFTQPTRLLVFDEEKTFSGEEIANFYIGLIESSLRMASRNKPIFIPLVFHPAIVALYDPELKIHREILGFCKKENVELISYKEIYRCLKK